MIISSIPIVDRISPLLLMRFWKSEYFRISTRRKKKKKERKKTRAYYLFRLLKNLKTRNEAKTIDQKQSRWRWNGYPVTKPSSFRGSDSHARVYNNNASLVLTRSSVYIYIYIYMYIYIYINTYTYIYIYMHKQQAKAITTVQVSSLLCQMFVVLHYID